MRTQLDILWLHMEYEIFLVAEHFWKILDSPRYHCLPRDTSGYCWIILDIMYWILLAIIHFITLDTTG